MAAALWVGIDGQELRLRYSDIGCRIFYLENLHNLTFVSYKHIYV